MDFEEIVRRLKDWVKRVEGKNLEPLEEEILRLVWKDKSYDQMEIEGYTVTYIKNIVAPKLFKRLSKVIGQEITKKNCKLVLKPLLEHNGAEVIALTSRVSTLRKANPLQHIDLSEAPDVSVFYGRSRELRELERWIIKNRCRLVGVFGMSGIGKTALVVKLVEKIQQPFEYVIWKSLEHSPSIEEILADIEYHLPSNDSETSLPETVDKRIFRLINCLDQHRCLLVLDSWEAIMRTNSELGKPQDSYSNYGKLLKKIGEGRHQSCLVFTSLEPPKEIKSLVNQKTIREFSVSGLEHQDAKALLKDYGLSDPGLEQLINRYRGHPLAFKMASRIIQNCHNGQISEFLKGTIFINDVILSLLDKQFSYLSDFDQNIMQNLAKGKEPLLISQIFQELPLISQSDILQSVNKLLQISLIEKQSNQQSETLFTLNALVNKYVKKRYGIPN